MKTKTQSLRSKWTVLTTSLTFIIFMIFSLFIIFLISTYQKEQEVEDLRKSVTDISNLFEEKTTGEVTQSDIYRAINKNEKVFLYNLDGNSIYDVSTNSSYDFDLPVIKTNERSLVQKKIGDRQFLLMSTPFRNEHYNGYITVARSLDD
ncbi:hypothetical protein, partial [Macrococcoides bohemicum]